MRTAKAGHASRRAARQFPSQIRESTINRPGLALSGSSIYFAEKRVQVLARAENTLSCKPVVEPVGKTLSRFVRTSEKNSLHC